MSTPSATAERAQRRRAGARRGEGKQAERGDRREKRADDEEEGGARLPPGHEQPAGGERRVEQREPERDVAEREHRHGESERDADALAQERRRERDQREQDRPAVRVERQGGGGPAGEERREDRRERLSGLDPRRELESRVAATAVVTPRRAARRRARGPSAAWPGSSRARCRRARRSRFGRSGRNSPSGRAPASIARAVSSIEPRQNGCRPASASHSITPTAQTSAAGVASPPASRSGEMYASVPGHVSRLGQRLGVGHLREPEVEDARRDAVAVGEQDVRGLDVAMQDPGRMCVGEAVADLRAGLDRVVVRQVARRAAPRGRCGPGTNS